MEQKYVDLHTHTFYSDGLDTPDTVVRNSFLKGTEVLAITDHDTMAGYEEAKKEADRWGMQLIPGVEVSTEIYHILGLNVNPYSERFQNFLKKSREIQREICEKRIKLLQKAKYPITLEKVVAAFPKSRLGKYNVFMTMLIDPECRKMIKETYGIQPYTEIFQFLLGKKGIAGKIEKDRYISSSEAIKEIKAAGGIAIVAHPFKEARTPADLDILFEEGLDGLEIQPNYADSNNPYLEYALKKRCRITYGSDYHGSAFTRPLLSRKDNLLNLDATFPFPGYISKKA